MAPGLFLWSYLEPQRKPPERRQDCLVYLMQLRKTSPGQCLCSTDRRTLEHGYPLTHQKIQHTQFKCCSVYAQIHTLKVQSVCPHIHVSMITCRCWFYIQVLRTTQVGVGQATVRTSSTSGALESHSSLSGVGKNLGDRERLAFKEPRETQPWPAA